ncbi:MAG TPA: bifunctional methionine sulfoxide reductase B/A protein [bacterium]|nr:bifunctional methionine sulfoxide reductase B/A protein [bacterium]
MKKANKKPLNEDEKRVILEKGTEKAFSGKYWNHFEKGTFVCRNCGAQLYRSDDKFDSGCGWPAFDDELAGAVKRQLDADGKRTEIVCAKCGGHLGHVFKGEQYTPKDTRHCVNSLSIKFIPDRKTGKAVFAAGCFWGVEYHFSKASGVISVKSGYTGGTVSNPSYKQVCSGATGHFEAVEVIYDPSMTTYEELLKLFFEMHDFTLAEGKFPERGNQYLSAIFYSSPGQKKTAENVIRQLQTLGYNVATKLLPASDFWVAEEYHQKYYEKKGSSASCHALRKIF